MATDFEGAIPVRSARNTDLVSRLADSLGVNLLKVNADGSVDVVVPGSVTVTATDLDIRDLNSGTDSVTVVATDLDIRPISSATDSITVIATDLDTRDLSSTTDSVTAVIDLGTDVDLKTVGLAIASDSTVELDYVVGSGILFRGETLLVGGRGACKIEIGIAVDPGDTNVFTASRTYFQQPAQNIDHVLKRFTFTGNGTDAVRVRVTNTDKSASDIYVNLQGVI